MHEAIKNDKASATCLGHSASMRRRQYSKLRLLPPELSITSPYCAFHHTFSHSKKMSLPTGWQEGLLHMCEFSQSSKLSQLPTNSKICFFLLPSSLQDRDSKSTPFTLIMCFLISYPITLGHQCFSFFPWWTTDKQFLLVNTFSFSLYSISRLKSSLNPPPSFS